MNKITKAVLGAALAVPMALGVNVVGAQAAQAATFTIRSYNICTYDAAGHGYSWLRQVAVTDYSAWEEFWYGYKDKTVILSTTRTPSTDWKCNVWYA